MKVCFPFLAFDIWTSIVDVTISFLSYFLLVLSGPYTMERYSSISILIVFVIKNSSNPLIPHSRALPLCLYPIKKKTKSMGCFHVSNGTQLYSVVVDYCMYNNKASLSHTTVCIQDVPPNGACKSMYVLLTMTLFGLNRK